MKTVKLIMTSLFVAGATFLVAETLPNKGPVPFNLYDADGNNVITTKEFDTIKAQKMTQKAQEGRLMKNVENTPVFSDIDVNKDGIINQNEYKTHQENRYKVRVNQKNKMMKKGNGFNNKNGSAIMEQKGLRKGN